MKILVFLIVAFVLVSVFWRLFSRRQSLPCPVWLRWMVEMDNPFIRTNRAAVIIELLDVQPGMTVLDAGCGPGRLSLPLSAVVGETGMVTAMDIQQGMLDAVSRKASETHRTNMRLLNAGLGDGKLTQDKYDIALLVTVLGEIPDRAAAMGELYTAIKPGGRLSVTEVIFDPHFQRYATVRQLAAAAGFQELGFYGRSWAYTAHFIKTNTDN